MGRVFRLYAGTVGKKAVVAVTGIVLFGFVVLHMIGNLKTFLGTDEHGVPEVDVYARFLRTVGEPALPRGSVLWTVRVVLLVAAVLHVATVVQLAVRNRRARPIRYARLVQIESTLAARTMLWSGWGILVFVVLHVLHFTTGTLDPTRFAQEQVYANLYHAFRLWYVALLYVAAMLMLAFHLYHGVWSLFQSLGVDNPDRNRGLRLFAAASAVVVFVGFCAVPVVILLGVISEPAVVAVDRRAGGE